MLVFKCGQLHAPLKHGGPRPENLFMPKKMEKQRADGRIYFRPSLDE